MEPPPILGPFALLSRVGEGATSIVWSGVHQVTATPAALKILKAAPDARHREALRHEVRAVASLDHPGIVSVLDQGDAETPWVAMELVRGGTLGPLCGRLAWPAVRPILSALLGALGHAHARGVVHRDVKPSNVLLDEHGAPRLVDFGIAAVLHDRPVHGAM